MRTGAHGAREARVRYATRAVCSRKLYAHTLFGRSLLRFLPNLPPFFLENLLCVLSKSGLVSHVEVPENVAACFAQTGLKA